MQLLSVVAIHSHARVLRVYIMMLRHRHTLNASPGGGGGEHHGGVGSGSTEIGGDGVG
jgi:hypothetical protein